MNNARQISVFTVMNIYEIFLKGFALFFASITLLIFLNMMLFAEMFLLFVSWNSDEIMFLTALAIFQFMSQAAELFLKGRHLRHNPAWVFL